jgi:hypothetical protein
MMEKNWLFHYGDFTPDNDAPPEVEQEFLEQLDAESKEYGHALSKVRLHRPSYRPRTSRRIRYKPPKRRRKSAVSLLLRHRYR